MNPRNLGNFFKSKFGLFVVFVVVLFSGLWMYGRHQAGEREAAKLAAQKGKKIELGQVKLPLNQGLESGVPQHVNPNAGTAAEKETAGGGIVPFRPAAPVPATSATIAATGSARTGSAPKAEPKPRKVRYASLLASYEAPPARTERVEPPAPERFIPFGTLLKCKLVNTIDSANLETPVIAMLLEDVWQNGKKVIPANTLVHGTARSGRMRDRVTAMGAWRFVWQDGRELVFNGVALDREYEHESDGYGITDGSGGIKGRVLATDDLQELKMLASAALSGFARGTQDRQQSALGTTITGSVSNGVREGVGDVFDLYAKRTLKDIEENGYFVRVAAGKEFYVYVLESVDPQKTSIAGVKLRANAAAANEGAAQAPLQNPTKG
ncbi:MAG: TrbI/VirB10 family protein [Opitutaceae bacterium]